MVIYASGLPVGIYNRLAASMQQFAELDRSYASWTALQDWSQCQIWIWIVLLDWILRNILHCVYRIQILRIWGSVNWVMKCLHAEAPLELWLNFWKLHLESTPILDTVESNSQQGRGIIGSFPGANRDLGDLHEHESSKIHSLILFRRILFLAYLSSMPSETNKCLSSPKASLHSPDKKLTRSVWAKLSVLLNRR